MSTLVGLVLTFIMGLFFLLGAFINSKVKEKEKLNHFSIALAFVIIIGLLIFDLIPEMLELLEENSLQEKLFVSIVFSLIGLFLLKILDCFIPDHHHNHQEHNDNKIEHVSHLKHIGILTLISLILHNILEGFAVFGLTESNTRVGLLICLSVALHNIPLGTTIFSSINLKENKKAIFLLTISGLLGAIIYLLIPTVSSFILAIITSITIGMLIYIVFFELFEELLSILKEKTAIMGLICGLVIIALSLLI